MRNAVRCGKAMVAANRMDGYGPPSRPQSSYRGDKLQETAEPVIYSNPADFLKSLKEDFGVNGRAADACLTEGEMQILMPFRGRLLLAYVSGDTCGRFDVDTNSDIETEKNRLQQAVDRSSNHVRS